MKKRHKQKKIILYTTLTCTFCHMVKQLSKEEHVPFEEVDVSTNKKALGEMVRKSGQVSVPVLDVNGTIIVGFDREALKRAISKV